MKAKLYATPKPCIHFLNTAFSCEHKGEVVNLPVGHRIDITEKKEKNAHYLIMVGGEIFRIPTENVSLK